MLGERLLHQFCASISCVTNVRTFPTLPYMFAQRAIGAEADWQLTSATSSVVPSASILFGRQSTTLKFVSSASRALGRRCCSRDQHEVPTMALK